MFATYKYCLAQSTPSNLILTTKRELNSDGVRAFLCQCWMGRDVGTSNFCVPIVLIFLTALSLLIENKTMRRSRL